MRNTNLGIISKYLYLTIIEGIIVLIFLLGTQSATNQNILGGYSSQRLILILGIFALTSFLAIFTFLFIRPSEWRLRLYLTFSKNNFQRLISIIIICFGLIFGSILFLIPGYRINPYDAYVIRLRPILIWGFIFSIQTLLVFAFIHKKNLPRFFVKKQTRILPLVAGFAFLLFLLLWLFIAQTGFGITPDDRYWNVVSVPILNEQIIASLLVSLLFLWLTFMLMKKISKKSVILFLIKRQDIIIIIILWFVAAAFWIQEPLPKNFFAPGPYPPNNEYHPYADPAGFDIGGQFSLIGQGLYNGVFYDRALLSGFLALLHLLAGQNYSQIITLQVLILASLVPVLYLIGKTMHSRGSGIMLALLGLFKIRNSIASSTLIQSSHPKFMLTEFPTSVLIALITLWMIRWFKDKNPDWSNIILSGGALGLGIMLRSNMLLIFLLLILFIILKFGFRWKQLFQTGIILLLAFFITISPWMWRSQKVAKIPLFFLPRFEDVIRTRYSLHPQQYIQKEIARSRIAGIDNLRTEKKELNFTASPWLFVPNHFLHNIVSSVLSLPTSLTFHDLSYTIKEAYPYWGKVDGQWRGGLTTISKITLTVNLALIALGLGLAWGNGRFASLVPLSVFLTYHLSNGLARTSGGRYLVPVDWVILLYFALGVMQILFWGAALFGVDFQDFQENQSAKKPFSYRKGVITILPFFLIVGFITVIDQTIPQRYPDQTKDDVQTMVIERGLLEQTGISAQELTKFLQQPDSRAFLGLNLYPRFYNAGKGEHSAGKDAYEEMDFSRLAFTMIGPFGQTGAVIPLASSPSYFPNATDVILIGCQHLSDGYLFPYVDALIVFVLGEKETAIYTRDSVTSLECPLSPLQ